MSKQILIELVGENETGYCYADLYLPASAEEIAEAKERANWNSDSNGIRDISIEHCSTLPKLASFRLDSPTLDELNFLAQRLDAMDGGERTIMNGVLQYLCSEKGFADELVSMTDLINMTYGLDGVMIASNVGTDRQLGQFVIDNELNEDLDQKQMQVEDELTKALDALYCKNVPAGVRDYFNLRSGTPEPVQPKVKKPRAEKAAPAIVEGHENEQH